MEDITIGIVAEGRSDCAVLSNLLYGLGYEDYPQFLRPQFSMDESDLKEKENYEMATDEFSSWTLVKKDCEEQEVFTHFLGEDNNPFDEDRYIIIQIDGAECDEYGVTRPEKDNEYYTNLRNEIIEQIDKWLESQYKEKLIYAITIEETEAWIHTLYGKIDTGKKTKAKEVFFKMLQKTRQKNKKLDKQLSKLTNKKAFERYEFYSQGFKKIKKKNKSCLNYNQSLKDFVEEFKQKINL